MRFGVAFCVYICVFLEGCYFALEKKQKSKIQFSKTLKLFYFFFLIELNNCSHC